jgi:hypothetical protein
MFKKAKTTKWEYRSLTYPVHNFENNPELTEFDEALNELGAKGWELVTVFTYMHFNDPTAVATFKRPIKDRDN